MTNINIAKKYKKRQNNNIILKYALKNAFILIIILIILISQFIYNFFHFNNSLQCKTIFNFSGIVWAENDENNEDEKELLEQLNDQVDSDIEELNFTELEVMLADIQANGSFDIFGDLSFVGLVKEIIAGNFIADFGSLLSGVWQGVISGFKASLAPLIVIVVITLLYILYSSLISGKTSSGVTDVIRLICLGSIVVILLGLSGSVIKDCSQAIIKMQQQMNVVFPILITLMTTMGSVVSVKAYQPTVLFLSSAISNIFTYVLLPIFTCVLVMSIANNFSNKRNLGKLQNFFKSFFKWIIATVFAIYMSILSFQGITAGSSDGISIKATKYAMKNYIPYLGGYISEGFELVKASSLLLKNSVGYSALLLLIVTIIAPLVTLMVFSLSLKLIAGLIEPLGDSKVSGFIENFANTFKMLAAIVIGVALMYFFTLTIMICTTNIL